LRSLGKTTSRERRRAVGRRSSSWGIDRRDAHCRNETSAVIGRAARIADPLAETEQIKELYHQLTEARTKTGEPTVPFHRFAEAVRAQVTKLGGGDSDVVFRVELKEGKATLAVKSAKGD
jgi:hypothetical protein